MKLSQEEKDKKFSDFIFYISDYKRLHRNDLEFCLNYYIGAEEYEKCSVINKIIKEKKYDNRRRCYLDFYTVTMSGWKKIDDLIKKYDMLEPDKKQEKLVEKVEDNEDIFWSILDKVKDMYTHIESK